MDKEEAVIEESAPSEETEVQEQEPAEEGAESAAAEEEGEETPEGTPEEEQGSEPPKELGEKGKKELITTRKRAQSAEAEAAYWRGKAEALESVDKKAKAVIPPVEDKPPVLMLPDLDDFETSAQWKEATAKAISEYNDKRDDWREKKAKANKPIEDAQATAAQKTQTLLSKLQAEAGDDAVQRAYRIALTDDMLKAIRELSDGHKVLRTLVENPDSAARIARMDPVLQGMEIGKVAASITTKTTKNTNAAPPASTVAGRGAKPSTYFDPNLSTEERIKLSRARKGQA